MLFKGQNHKLLKDFISHKELLGSSGDVSVVVEDSHACESSDVDLDGNVSSQISMNLGFLGWVNSWIESGSCIIEALVSDFIDHLLIINIYYNLILKNKYHIYILLHHSYNLNSYSSSIFDKTDLI